jgi:multidrug efflux pump subunit AcrA (membrane-fusion protein)
LLNLERTELVAPFNATVIDKDVEIGSQISSQSTVATLVGADTYWVRISIPHRDLSLIHLPWQDQTGSNAVITNISQSYGAELWQGMIIKVLPDVDPQGLMARILVAVDKPLIPQEGTLPLLLGSVVNVRIEGKAIEDCFAIPRETLRPDNTVLIASPDGTLDIRPVSVAWQNDEFAYVTGGLFDQEQLIVSNVAAPIQGMPLILQAR